jgi:hypothetical protein
VARVSHGARGICSLCRAPIADRATAPTIEVKLAPMFGGATSRLGSAGRYCGEACLAAMKAVDAVRELRGDDLADALLALYRRGGGPAPTLVLTAVDRVTSGHRQSRDVPCVRVAYA